MFEDIPLYEKHAFRGRWWRAGKPMTRFSGTLFSSPREGLRLEVDGELFSFEEWENGVRPFAMFGITPVGQAITLRDCQPVAFEGRARSIIHPHFAFVGRRHERGENVEFKELRVQLQHLDEWAYIRTFDMRHSDNAKQMTITYKQPEPRVLARTEDFQLSVVTTNTGATSRHEASIKQKTLLRLEFHERKTMEDCLRFLRLVQDFFGLAIGSPPYPLSCTGFRGSVSFRNHRPYNTPVNILYEPVASLDDRELAAFQMLFTLSDMGDHADVFVANWTEKAAKLRPVYTLYMAGEYRPSLFLENKFLNVAQAVETYHRRVCGGKYQEDEAFQEGLYKLLVDAIPPDIDKDFRRSLVAGKLL